MQRSLKIARTACANQYAEYVIVDDIHVKLKADEWRRCCRYWGYASAYIAWKKETETEG